MARKWRPQHGMEYYAIELNDDGYVFRELYNQFFPPAKSRVKMGNCFRTGIRALSALKKIKAVLKGGK